MPVLVAGVPVLPAAELVDESLAPVAVGPVEVPLEAVSPLDVAALVSSASSVELSLSQAHASRLTPVSQVLQSFSRI